MSSANSELNDDQNHQSHDEIIDMKSLFKMLVESQNKQAESLARLGETQANNQQQVVQSLARQAESLAKLGETQANTQHQIIEILSRSTNNIDDQKGNIASGSGVDKQEIEDDEKDPELAPGLVATYFFCEHDRLYEAFWAHDVKEVIKYVKDNPRAIGEAIDQDYSTVLHAAIFEGQTTMAEEILKLVSDPISLECEASSDGYTPLHLAAFRGNVEAAKTMVRINSKLPQIRDKKRKTPLEIAVVNITAGQKEMVKFLYSVTRDKEPSPFYGNDGARLLCLAISANFYELALCLVKRFPKLVAVKSRDHNVCALELLARKPYAFGIGTKLTWWQDRLYSLIQVDMSSTYVEPVEPEEENPPESSENNEEVEISKTNGKSFFMPYLGRVSGITKLYNLKLMHKQADELIKQMVVVLRWVSVKMFFQENPDIIKLAMKHGITIFVAECMKYFISLNWEDMGGQRMLDMAIIERNEPIVSLICDFYDKHKTKTKLVSEINNVEENTILHHAAKLASPSQLSLIPGVALQIQRELQWLQGVGNMMPEDVRLKKNKEGYTAQLLFTKEHKELLKEGKEWMKDTSGSSMIVAALIATVAFAAAFTVPGGNISDSDSTKNGTPVFLGSASFTVFAVADAIALFSSITSVLMFLAIYTSRYSEMDFLKSLPQKLIIGLATLFISMAAILIGFCASLYIMVGDKFPRSIVPITLFGSVPVALFAWLQLPLFYEMVRSTYWGTLLQKHRYIDPRDEKYD